MLKRIEFYYNEDHGKVNIEDDKIYWDTHKNQFRHLFKCCDCGKELQCMCYDSLESALRGVDDGLTCEECGIVYILNDTSIEDLLYDLDDVRKEKAYKFLETLITRKEVEEFSEETGCNTLDKSDMMEIVENGDKEDILKNFIIIGLLTDEEKRDMWFDSCDEWPEGEACNL